MMGLAPATLRKWRVTGRGPRWHRLGHGPKARVGYSPEAIREFLGSAFTSTSEESEARGFRRTSGETAGRDGKKKGGAQ